MLPRVTTFEGIKVTKNRASRQIVIPKDIVTELEKELNNPLEEVDITYIRYANKILSNNSSMLIITPVIKVVKNNEVIYRHDTISIKNFLRITTAVLNMPVAEILNLSLDEVLNRITRKEMI